VENWKINNIYKSFKCFIFIFSFSNYSAHNINSVGATTTPKEKKKLKKLHVMHQQGFSFLKNLYDLAKICKSFCQKHLICFLSALHHFLFVGDVIEHTVWNRGEVKNFLYDFRFS
jgi:hypothetical protein